MKKFEEELKNGPVMIDKDNVTGTPIYDEVTLISYFNDWVSPEDYEKYIKESTDNTSKLLGQINELKDQLKKQKPEIPEVPRFVADCLALIEANNYMISHEQVNEHKEALTWLEVRQSDLMLPKCLLYGYTVEKEKVLVSPCPVCRYEGVRANFCGICGHKNEYVEAVEEKRFYLKHIDFCKRDKDYDWYMIKHSDGPLNHLRVEKETLPPTVDTYFTQQEIDSMETGSYEQIEVEE